MAETLSTTGASAMDMALKDNGIIVDMSPAAILHHNSMAAAAALRTLKEATGGASTDDQNSLTETVDGPTNLSSASSPPLTTFRCERCENFETSSRASLLLHVVQCLASGQVAARMKTEEQEPENMSVNHMVVDQQSGKSVADTKSSGLVVSAVANGISHQTTASSSSSSSSPAASSNNNNANGSRKVFECDVCNMKFSNGANMRRHKMRHTGVKPYECRVCQKRFFRKDHLAEHFTTHTKTLPYHCPICNRGFQRQIAMRAHFQNEHVGQHDLVKTCPLCSYRAGSMKSLRIHFFNRHGIDLDNPGPGGTSSLLLALESQASQVAAAAAAAGFVPGLNPVAAVAAAAAVNNNNNNNNNTNNNNSKNNINNVPPSHQSDSGDSMRSLENATPPMHFLTPHVEISTLPENGAPELYNGNTTGHPLPGNVEAMDTSSKIVKDRAIIIQSPVSVLGVPQDLPMDCNAKTSTMPSSTSSIHSGHNGKSLHHENHITPSISLIPIKQEPLNDEPEKNTQKEQSSGGGGGSSNGGGSGNGVGGDNSDSDFSSSNNRVTSLIKVSPLKSLLREDLKRRICAKANNRITRNAAALENNNVLPSTLGGPSTTPPNSITVTSTPICNGTITSTGQESGEMLLSRKQILTCHFCGIEFPDETLYFLHKGCHCDSNPWKCNICGEQCNNVYEFNSHLLSKSHQ